MKQSLTMNPLFTMHQIVKDQLKEALQYDVLFPMIRDGGNGDCYIQQENNCVGSGIKITKETLPDLDNLCQIALQRLGFKDKIEFYVTYSPIMNAQAVMSLDPNSPHLISIQSQCLNEMNDLELLSIIGHELGHLINKDQEIDYLKNTLYPDSDKIPYAISLRYKLFSILNEYSSDFWGCLACQDEKAAQMAEIKLMTGLKGNALDLIFEAIKHQNEEQIKRITPINSTNDHPFSALRIKAIQLFFESDNQEIFDKGMRELIKYENCLECDPQTDAVAYYISHLTLSFANKTHGELNQLERETLIRELGDFVLCPKDFLKETEENILNTQKIDNAKQMISEEGKSHIFSILVKIAIIDGPITSKEINILKEIASTNLNFDEATGNMLLLNELSKEFKYRIDACKPISFSDKIKTIWNNLKILFS